MYYFPYLVPYCKEKEKWPRSSGWEDVRLSHMVTVVVAGATVVKLKGWSICKPACFSVWPQILLMLQMPTLVMETGRSTDGLVYICHPSGKETY